MIRIPISITIPNIKKSGTVKDAVISILGQDWPISLKRIYNSVGKMGFNITYQAVHKAVSELVLENVLQRVEKGYKINPEWISRLRDFYLSLDCRYSDIPVGNNMIFNTLKDMDIFVMSMLEKLICPGEMKINCSHWRHAWWPLFASMKEYSILRKIGEMSNPNKIHITCKNGGAVESWCKDIYAKMGVNMKTGIMLEDNFDFMVYGDMVIQMYWPEDLMKRMDKAFSVESIKDIDVENVFTNIFEMETRINVMVIRNKEIANHFREKVLSHFRTTEEGD